MTTPIYYKGKLLKQWKNYDIKDWNIFIKSLSSYQAQWISLREWTQCHTILSQMLEDPEQWAMAKDYSNWKLFWKSVWYEAWPRLSFLYSMWLFLKTEVPREKWLPSFNAYMIKPNIVEWLRDRVQNNTPVKIEDVSMAGMFY